MKCLPRKESCCIWCSVRTGSLIFIFVELIENGLLTLLFGIHLSFSNPNETISGLRNESLDDLHAKEITPKEYQFLKNIYDGLEGDGHCQAILIVAFILCLVGSIFIALAIYGIATYRNRFMIPWLSYHTMLWAVGSLSTLGLSIWIGVEYNAGAGIVFFIFIALVLGFKFYYGLIVYSEYRNIRDINLGKSRKIYDGIQALNFE